MYKDTWNYSAGLIAFTLPFSAIAIGSEQLAFGHKAGLEVTTVIVVIAELAAVALVLVQLRAFQQTHCKQESHDHEPS